MKKQTLTHLKQYKQDGKKFASMTAYDATFARMVDEAGIECLLVGDSLGNVVQGQKTTVPVTLEEMCYHTECVSRGVERSLLMSDLPFMSYATTEQALSSAAELMQSGAEMVKLEGANWLEETIYRMTERGIPVCVHLGLLPQSVAKQGGYRIQGKDQQSAETLLNDAKNLEQAGADIILLECVTAELAKTITESVSVPVIGIGAGTDTDSQILVIYDALGISGRIPSFSKNFMSGLDSIQAALSRYAEEVKNSTFPGPEYTIS